MQTSDSGYLTRRDEQRVLVVLLGFCIIVSVCSLCFAIAAGVINHWSQAFQIVSVCFGSVTVLSLIVSLLAYLHFYYSLKQLGQ